jgi:hypothetical protein
MAVMLLAPSLLWVALQAGLPSPSPKVFWRVEGVQRCPTAGQLQSAYESIATGIQPKRPDLAVLVELEPSPQSIEVRLSIPEIHLVKHHEIEIADSPCREVTQTVAILVHAWLAELPELKRPLAPVAVESPPAPTPAVSPLPPSQSVVVVREQPAPTVSKSHSLGLELRAGPALLVSSGLSSSYAIAVAAELRITRQLGIAAFGSFEPGGVEATDTPYGRINVQRQLIGADVAVGLPVVDRLRIQWLSADVLIGAALWHGTAQSEGYPSDATRDLFEPACSVGVRIDEALGGLFFLEEQASALLLLRSLSLQIERPDESVVTVATVPWGSFAFGVALGVHIF